MRKSTTRGRIIYPRKQERQETKTLFHGLQGLRQGGPLSPFLFTIVVDLLSGIDRDSIKGINIGSQGVMVSHLQFGDNSILLLAAEIVL